MVGMLYRRDRWIVALIPINRREPEDPVPAQTAPPARSPSIFPVARAEWKCCKHGHGEQRTWRALLHPLRERVPRAQEILPIEEKRPPMQPFGPAPRFQMDSFSRRRACPGVLSIVDTKFLDRGFAPNLSARKC